MAKMDKLARAKQLADKGKLSRADFGALQQMSRGGFGGVDDGDGNEMPQDKEQDQAEGDETVSAEMVKAGVACLRANKGMKPAELVSEIYKAMEAAEPQD
jgi:hypothetical protein